MRIYGEVFFDVLYLCTVIFLGIRMIAKASPGSVKRLYGIMAVVLGAGDAFHLIPRVHALLTTGETINTPALGFGKLITSITMTAFYVMLYTVWTQYFSTKRPALTTGVYLLAACRVILCLLPQNDWFAADPPLLWGILRNVPFLLLGLLLIFLFWQKARGDKYFHFMWLAILLSFAFYIPVVLWADRYPAIGTLMIPKTLAYVWMVCMGMRKGFGENKK